MHVIKLGQGLLVRPSARTCPSSLHDLFFLYWRRKDKWLNEAATTKGSIGECCNDVYTLKLPDNPANYLVAGEESRIWLPQKAILESNRPSHLG